MTASGRLFRVSPTLVKPVLCKWWWCNTRGKVYTLSVLWTNEHIDEAGKKLVMLRAKLAQSDDRISPHIRRCWCYPHEYNHWRRAEDGGVGGENVAEDVGDKMVQAKEWRYWKNKTIGAPIGERMENKLYRSRKDRMLFGVCGGLGKFFGIDSTIIELSLCCWDLPVSGFWLISSSQ